MIRFILLSILSVILIGCKNYQINDYTITKFSVYSKSTSFVRETTNKNEIDRFKEFLLNSIIVNEIPNEFDQFDYTHRIYIIGNDLKGKWVYNSNNGFFSKLISYKVKPVLMFQITNITKFNQFIDSIVSLHLDISND